MGLPCLAHLLGGRDALLRSCGRSRDIYVGGGGQKGRAGQRAGTDTGAAFGTLLFVAIAMPVVRPLALGGRRRAIVVRAAVPPECVRAAAEEQQDHAGRGQQFPQERGRMEHSRVRMIINCNGPGHRPGPLPSKIGEVLDQYSPRARERISSLTPSCSPACSRPRATGGS